MTDQSDVPQGLSPEALDLFLDLTEGEEDLTAAQWQSALQAARLITTADRLEEAVGADLIVIGSAGQPVAHPALAEARQARATALSALGRIRQAHAPASAAGAALVAKRWAKRG